jgi:hypothetical protein
MSLALSGLRGEVHGLPTWQGDATLQRWIFPARYNETTTKIDESLPSCGCEVCGVCPGGDALCMRLMNALSERERSLARAVLPGTGYQPHPATRSAARLGSAQPGRLPLGSGVLDAMPPPPLLLFELLALPLFMPPEASGPSMATVPRQAASQPAVQEAMPSPRGEETCAPPLERVYFNPLK